MAIVIKCSSIETFPRSPYSAQERLPVIITFILRTTKLIPSYSMILIPT